MPCRYQVCLQYMCHYFAVNFGSKHLRSLIKPPGTPLCRCAVYKIGFVISSGDDDLYSDQGPSDRSDNHDACGQLCCDIVENKSKMKSLLFVFILQLDIHIQLNIFIYDKYNSINIQLYSSFTASSFRPTYPS